MNPHESTPGTAHSDDAEPWLKKAIGELKEPLPLATRSALKHARAEALEQLEPESSSRWPLSQWGMATMASIAVLALGWSVFNSPAINEQQSAPTATLAQADLAIINSPDDLEFYRDLDFVQWLENEGTSDRHGS